MSQHNMGIFTRDGRLIDMGNPWRITKTMTEAMEGEGDVK